VTKFGFQIPESDERDTCRDGLPGNTAELLYHRSGIPEAEDVHSASEECLLQSCLIALLAKRNEKFGILFLDDETGYLNILQSYVKKTKQSAAEVVVSTSMDEWPRIVSSTSVQLAIVDVDLRCAVDGFEVSRRIRKMSSETLICVHSNRGWREYQELAISSGADVFLPKPMTRTHFLKLMMSAAQGRRNWQHG
jgi:CheY-like chemotaxis protein